MHYQQPIALLEHVKMLIQEEQYLQLHIVLVGYQDVFIMGRTIVQMEIALHILELKLNVELLQQQNLTQHPKHVGKPQIRVMLQQHV